MPGKVAERKLLSSDGANVSQQSLLKQRISGPSHPSTSTSTAQRADHMMMTSAFLKHVLVYHLSGDYFLVVFIPIVLSNLHLMTTCVFMADVSQQQIKKPASGQRASGS